MEEQWILDFCGHCGTLLTEGLGLEPPEPRCENCGNSVKEREFRCQGTFTNTDARRLLKASA